MKLPTRVHRAWVRFCIEARRLWAWHHAQMNANAPYARALVQGVVRALWQESVERVLVVLAKATVELFVILRRDGFDPNGYFAD